MNGRVRINSMLELYRHEIKGSFYSWRGGIWIVAASLILSLVTYLLLTDKELSLLDQGEMLWTTAEVILALGLIMSATTASSAISSEIESGTFESLLLTPMTSIQISLQKLFSTITIWTILYLVSIPYLVVISNGTNLGLSAILYVGLYGTLLIIAFALISITISSRLKSSKNSIMTMIMIILILIAPSLFFASSLKKTDFGIAIENINPVSHAINSIDSVVVDNEQSLIQQINHIWPIILFTAFCGFIFTIFNQRFEIRGLE
jgi:ABC-2 type transport system permease protein